MGIEQNSVQAVPCKVPPQQDANDTVAISLGARKYPSTDPAGYALQTLEAALLSKSISRPTYFKAPSLAILELAPAIALLPSRRLRLECLKTLIEPAITGDTYRSYISAKLPHLLHFVGPREKVELLSWALSIADRRFQGKIGFAIVRAAKDAPELSRLVSPRRVKALLQTRHPELRELVAKASLWRCFRKIGFPQGISRAHSTLRVEQPSVSRKLVRHRLKDMYDHTRSLLKEVDSQPRFTNSRTAREFRRSLKEALAMLKPHVGHNGALPRVTLSRHKGAQLANLLAVKVPTELAYGIHFARTHRAGLPYARPWRIEDIRAVIPALKEIPAAHLIMTPLLHQIVLTTQTSSYGTRSANGPITLSDRTKRNYEISREFGGCKGRHVLVVHEVGHAIQIGKAKLNLYQWDSDDGSIEGPADPLYDFTTFCSLSGWRIATDRPWTALYDGQALSINGEQYPIGTPTVYHGARVVFVAPSEAGSKMLLARDPEAQFPVSENAQEEPWEDWAEGFSEYILAPERFAVFAPEKFLYFHVHFRKYPEDHPIVQKLYSRLYCSKLEDRIELKSKNNDRATSLPKEEQPTQIFPLQELQAPPLTMSDESIDA